MKRLIFSNHAAKRMFERDVSARDVELAIEMPDYKIVRGSEVEAYKRFSHTTLKVVYAEIESFIKVITVVTI